ncbi:DNA replication/repair protein RecF [Flavihumibacter solisilvae]|uniref:DNA replication and repair protein RecF n=1 Tax=Flavihumibacter solisilvae TaxID=1349421 RepID=A0A0C1L199_9BACT|nr:DNA replication and repair protein RecF [Flavihumibacter solisilvae]KIC93807.1 DNA recombination protein RecF [Flavihumibacter solisilvae]
MWKYIAANLLSLQNISVFQYKNYLGQSWTFPERVTGITGRNGTGKTNLLDAIYFLCFTKSYFQKSDAQLVYGGAQGMRISGRFVRQEETYDVSAVIRENGKKEFRVNEMPCEKMADHIGQFPAVMVAPDDVQIITGGSEERRRFMDALFSQVDHDYLVHLMTYNRLLQQRNSLLKQMAEQRSRQFELLSIIDEQMNSPASYVFEKRTLYLRQLLEEITTRYIKIAGEQYDLRMQYESPMQQGDWQSLLRRNRDRDIASQRTTSGIHRDDISISLEDKMFRQTASQGQRKSMLFAFRLAEFSLLKEKKGFAPILLLDDVFEKLDQQRMQNLLYEVCVLNDGQVLVTDTHPDRIGESFSALGLPYQSIETSR